MIRVSFISPTSMIQEFGSQGDFHLALAHLLGPVDQEPNEYEKELIASGLPIYLDNGLFENGQSVGVYDLMRKAVHLNAEYVFAPDVLYDRKATEANIDEAYAVLEKIKEDFPESKTKLAAVVQANNPDDFLESFEWMSKNDKISLIGLSILSVPYSFKDYTLSDDIAFNRIVAQISIEMAAAANQFEPKATHMLGAGSSYTDIHYATKNSPWIVSHDSSSAIWNGVQEKKINPFTLTIEGGKTKVHVNFEHPGDLSFTQTQAIKHNIEVIKSVVK